MVLYVIVRHGSNADNQPMCLRKALGIIEAKGKKEAIQKAYEFAKHETLCWNNQHLEAIPRSAASNKDWLEAQRYGMFDTETTLRNWLNLTSKS